MFPSCARASMAAPADAQRRSIAELHAAVLCPAPFPFSLLTAHKRQPWLTTLAAPTLARAGSPPEHVPWPWTSLTGATRSPTGDSAAAGHRAPPLLCSALEYKVKSKNPRKRNIQGGQCEVRDTIE